jgi:hypothetical protein
MLVKSIYWSMLTGMALFIIAAVDISNVMRFGGAFAFIPLIAFIFFLSRIAYKEFQKELDLISIFLMLLLFFNYIAGMEFNNVDHFEYLLYAQIVIMVLIIVSFVAVVMSDFNFNLLIRKNVDEGDRKTQAILQKIYCSVLLGPSLAFLNVILCNSKIFKNIYISTGREVNVIYSTTSMIIFSLCLFFSFEKTRNIDKKYVQYVLQRKTTSFKKEDLKKFFLYSILFLLIAGAGVEIGRGYWFLWIATILLYVITVMTAWNFWKYNFEEADSNLLNDLNPDGLKFWFSDVKFLIKLIILSALVYTAYKFFVNYIFR